VPKFVVTVNVLAVLSKLQGFKRIVRFGCRLVVMGKVLLFIVSIQEPDWTVLVPVAVPLAEISLKLVALMVKAREVGKLVKEVSNTPPPGGVEKVKL
jgi:hypothetical protein